MKPNATKGSWNRPSPPARPLAGFARVAAEHVVRQRQAFVTFGLGELCEFAHDRAIATDIAERQGNSEMHGRFLVLAGCWFPANL
jgi:hypothetical protein